MEESKIDERADRIVLAAQMCVAVGMAAKLTYDEGIIMFKVAAESMEQIDKTPDAEDDALTELTMNRIKELLRELKE